jgi:hypothetical protein
MKKLSLVLCLYAIYGCTQVISQEPSEEERRDREFRELLQQVKEVKEKNKKVLENAEEKRIEMVIQTKEKIVTLKKEVTVLKEELHEALTKSDTIDLNINFKLLPISGNKEDRK